MIEVENCTAFLSEREIYCAKIRSRKMGGEPEVKQEARVRMLCDGLQDVRFTGGAVSVDLGEGLAKGTTCDAEQQVIFGKKREVGRRGRGRRTRRKERTKTVKSEGDERNGGES